MGDMALRAGKDWNADMPRRKRREYTEAVQHVYGRGNYKAPIFREDGAADCFLATLEECIEKFGWLVLAYVIMPNHYHLVLVTPKGNRSAGMHWLLATFSRRFNSFRAEHGHVFQGRYQAKPMPGSLSAARLLDYINLNPVRAGLCRIDELGHYPLCSMRRLLNPASRGPFPVGDGLTRHLGYEDSPAGHRAYLVHLAAAHRQDPDASEFLADLTEAEKEEMQMSRVQRASLGLDEGKLLTDVQPARIAEWERVLKEALARRQISPADIPKMPKGASWKVDIAAEVRQATGAPLPWLAAQLKIGSPGHLSWLLARRK